MSQYRTDVHNYPRSTALMICVNTTFVLPISFLSHFNLRCVPKVTPFVVSTFRSY